MVGRLGFPAGMLVVPATLMLYAEGLDEDGAPMEALQWDGGVWYSEKATAVVDREGRQLRLEGCLVAQGDIALALPKVADGEAVVAGRSYRVYRVERPRNPDGTVHHTTVWLA